jgi:lysophospholipase
MVLAAPFVGFGPTRPPWPIASRLAAAMTALGLGEVSAPGQARETMGRIPFEGNALTGDPARFARNKQLALSLPQVFVQGPTYAWLYAASRALREVGEPEFTSSVRVPSLVVVGALERVVSITAVERLAADLRSASNVVIPGGEHELLMERDRVREQFFAAFDAFVPGS